MPLYNPAKPLLFIHVPKTGGHSLGRVFWEWFPRTFRPTYTGYNKPAYKKLKNNPSTKACTVYFGHIPKVPTGWGNQVMTVLRDPFNRAVSEYFHRKRRKMELPYDSLEDFIKRAIQSSMATRFEGETVTLDNYKEYIDKRHLFVGAMEHLQASIDGMADVLGKQSVKVEKRNVGKHLYDEPIPEHLREEFEAKYALDVAIHRYVLRQFE